jgi:hypothetical protein
VLRVEPHGAARDREHASQHATDNAPFVAFGAPEVVP